MIGIERHLQSPWCCSQHFQRTGPPSTLTPSASRNLAAKLNMGGQSARGRNSVYVPPPPPSGEPYPLSPLLLTSLIVLVYSLAVMPLFPASVKQGVGALSQRGFVGRPQNQFQFSWDRILANIGAPAGAAPGAVIASPSRKDPDYFVSPRSPPGTELALRRRS